MPYNANDTEKKIQEFWEQNGIFEKSLEQTKKGKPFVFYDGPPFATGTPHYGHLLQSAVKDAIPRYKTMRGFYVERQWGWDCHGLPIENIVEKLLGTKSKKDIMAMGVKKFNDACREQIFTFIHEWERIIPRFGRWADMQNPYRTMDFAYMEKEWWAFKELYKKGLIYEDYRSMHVCPRCETTLSQGEVSEGYKDIKDLSVTVKFKVKNPTAAGLPENSYFLAWTTTPWTLPGNVALAVGEKIEYVIAQKDGENLIFAKSRMADVLGERAPEYHLVNERKGKSLAGISYEPLFDYYAKDLPAQAGENLENRENGWKVYVADFVTDEDGTGIAHEAPAFGADDWKLLKQVNLPFVQHTYLNGTYKPEVTDFPGASLIPRAKDNPEEVREVDLDIKKYLEQKGLLFASQKYLHSYPHCWRCDTALLNYATSSWFVAVEKVKPQLLKAAKKITWSPEHIKEGRFGQWLEGARDWSISRQRFWANTIPVWRCDQCKHEQVFGSAKELEKASGVLVDDLHKEVVDEVTFTCKCGGLMKRVPDVLDTWFDSGSMSFATNRKIPADFIAEAAEQAAKWFYYQHVLATMLFGKEAFKYAVGTGIVLAEDGKKMSKKLQNYPDPSAVMEKYGADAMRFYILSSPVVRAENLAFSEKGVDEIAKKNMGRLANVLEFYKLYDNGTPAGVKSKNLLDRWILSRLNGLIAQSTQGYEQYQLDSAVRPLTDFIDDLSVWYLRRSRERFKEDGQDKTDALATLRHVLGQLALVMAPVMPFFAEYLFQAVKDERNKESAHLEAWPGLNKKLVDITLEADMAEARQVVTLALAERITAGIKVRQPLSLLNVKNEKSIIRNNTALLEVIKDEVNVKEIVFNGAIEKDVELDATITEALKKEGEDREIIRAINDLRKAAGYSPGEMITLYASADLEIDVLRPTHVARTASMPESVGEDHVVKHVQIGGGKLSIAVVKK